MKITPNPKLVIKESDRKKSISEIDMKIVVLLLEGYTSKQIGEKVFLAEKTVGGRILEMRRKFEAKNTLNLMAILIKRKVFTIK